MILLRYQNNNNNNKNDHSNGQLCIVVYLSGKARTGLRYLLHVLYSDRHKFCPVCISPTQLVDKLAAVCLIMDIIILHHQKYQG